MWKEGLVWVVFKLKNLQIGVVASPMWVETQNVLRDLFSHRITAHLVQASLLVINTGRRRGIVKDEFTLTLKVGSADGISVTLVPSADG